MISIKQVFNYFLKTNPKQIWTDWREYQKLATERDAALAERTDARKKIASTEMPKRNGPTATCIVEFPRICLDQIGRLTTTTGVSKCKNFTLDTECDNMKCECYGRYANYINANRQYNALVQARQQFWGNKFSNVK